jgi:hypothetical protein
MTDAALDALQLALAVLGISGIATAALFGAAVGGALYVLGALLEAMGVR